MSEALVEIDGSFGEGGGQILRTSLALALVTGKPFHLRHIRARRSRPGLQPQHLMSVRAAATIGQAQTRGASLGSSDLVFEPGAVRAGTYRFDVGTAGAVGLVTTHDLSLTHIVDRLAPQSANIHFADSFESGVMKFDYRVHEGVVRHSNALALMRAVGLEV